MDPAIAGRSGVPLCGLAVTVNARPADNLMVHKALEIASPGDVVVVSTGGNSTSAVLGGLMCASAAAKGLGGIVVDGAIRDVDEIVELQFPAYSRTLSPGGCDKDGPGEINVPISCGGVVVQSGDVVVGDRDGVAVVPREHAAEVLELVQALIAREASRLREIRDGVLFKTEIDDALRTKGVL
jgi:regulator of RNase E activity RraA